MHDEEGKEVNKQQSKGVKDDGVIPAARAPPSRDRQIWMVTTVKGGKVGK